ncbi:hypothetical protein KC19_10G078600 [Ceratodon purpureus]|uniref:Peptidase C14 caspase domain-containing protein n=1 Tax=Ceratodon purpureus TaxID=3225 RepID=A0A8T0GQ17_CERPU|nr:hypothetical protein KC19_10G078600 [Ceratodon purpureus]
MSKRALLVGCNYPGTKCELHGCANDVRRMKALLTDRFGFDEADILVMLDTDPSLPQPTGKNIRRCLAKLIENTQAGDCLVFHYSGHGTQVPAESGEVDDTGSDEAIVPTDMNLLTDDDFRDLVNKIPVGVTFTFLSDSCHSGGLIDSTKEQIGDTVVNYASLPSNAGDEGSLFGMIGKGIDAFDGEEGEGGEAQEKSGFRGFLSKAKAKIKDHASHRGEGEARPDTQNFDFESQYLQETGQTMKNKNLDINTLTEILSQRTGHDVKVGNIRTTIFDMFGDDASPKVKTFVNVILTQLQGAGAEGGFMGMVSGLAGQFLKAKLDSDTPDQAASYTSAAGTVHPSSARAAYGGVRPSASHRVRPDAGILLSGCQHNETSADATPAGDHSQSYGAFSNALINVLAQTDGPISNRDLVMRIRETLSKSGFKQHPCLFCTDENADAHFICVD